MFIYWNTEKIVLLICLLLLFLLIKININERGALTRLLRSTDAVPEYLYAPKTVSMQHNFIILVLNKIDSIT